MGNVMSMRIVPALLAALLLPLLAGCGSGGSAGSAASAVPEDVAVYVSVDSSFEGDQWRAVRDLLAKFPDGEGALDELLDNASGEASLSKERLQDALGPEVAIAVLEIPTGEDATPPVVVLTRPDDTDAFRQLFADDQATAFAEVKGWEAAAPDEATLDAYREALEGPTLGSSAEFDETMDDLGDGLVHAYVNGEAILQAFASQPDFPAGAFPLPTGADLGSIGAVLEAENDGVRIDGRAVLPDQAAERRAEPYSSELVEEVPSGALAFVSFKGLGESLESGAGGMGAFLPFDLTEVAGLLAGETAVYVTPGQPEPAITLVTEVDDEAAALRTVEGLVGLAGPEGAALAYDAFDGLLAVSTSPAEILALRSDSPRLDQDDAFERAAEQAGLPDETTGFGYVDLEAAVPLFLGLSPAAGADDSEAKAYLEPLGSVVFWGGSTGAVQDFSLFVGIE